MRLDDLGVGELVRGEAVVAVKEYRQRRMEELAAWLDEQINEVSGLDVCIRLTEVTDEVVAALFERALKKVGAPKDAVDKLGVFALGGYGRGELNPSSDLDILVCRLDVREADWMRDAYAEFNTLLWDVGFKVGGSARAVKELDRIIKDDFVTATALLEQRAVVAGSELTESVERLMAQFCKKRRKVFLRYKVEELQGRRSKAGESVLRMEPDLKTNPGCLRDVQLLMNVANVLFGERSLRCLTEVDGLDRNDVAELYAANNFVLKIRSLQHFEHKRAQDVWTLRDQLRCAEQLGYSSAQSLRGVEVMMREFYGHLRAVDRVVDRVLSFLRNKGHTGSTIVLVKTRKKITPYFASIAGEVYCSNREVWRRPDVIVELMKLCRVVQQRGLRFSYAVQGTIADHIHMISDEDRCHPEAARLFREIMGDTARLMPFLGRMHGTGLLGAWLPEFGNITCLMQFSSFHQYTVDEHTLRGLTFLTQAWNGEEEGLPHMQIALRGLKDRDILALSLLLHDIGKYMGLNHEERGALMISAVAKRLGLRTIEEERITFLVRHHVLLSNASRMRDISDPDLLARLAQTIGSVHRLDLLYCVTWADVKSVGDNILTGWQEELLGELYLQLRSQLEEHGLSRRDVRIDFTEALTKGGLTSNVAESFITSMPPSYFSQAQPESAVQHVEMYQKFEEDGALSFHWETGVKSATIELVQRQRRFLLADTAAVLAGRGCDIVDASCWMNEAGITLCRFRVETTGTANIESKEWWGTVRKHILAAQEDEAYARKVLENRRRQFSARMVTDSGFNDPTVKIDRRSHHAAVIIDIQEKDDVGLLSRLCRLLAKAGCDITYASINTFGDVAVDVFYIQQDNKKPSEEACEGIRLRLEEALNVEGRKGNQVSVEQ